MEKIASFSQSLLEWYDQKGRELPWRRWEGPQDPYIVWISETMLQQTTVTTVKPYFERWMTRWPTLDNLSIAPLSEILHVWQGLGYYTRARNLHACAQQLKAQGFFPQDENDLLQLSGVGPYTAAAIRTIAFDLPAVAVDGNIVRVLSRYGGISSTGPSLKRSVHQLGTTLLPTARWGDYTQALMDLGSTLCTPRNPRCDLCPVSLGCYAYQHQQVACFPHKKRRPPLPKKHGDAFWIERQDGALFFEKETKQRLLHGLFRLPFSAFQEEPIEKTSFPFLGPWIRDPKPVTHTFTHFKLFLYIWRIRVSEAIFLPSGQWILREKLGAYPLSTLMKKIPGILLKKDEPDGHHTP